MSILKIDNLKKHYTDGDSLRHILKGVNYTFEKGKMYTVSGSSGSGKTTFLSIIAGLDQQNDGKVLYNDKDIRNIGLTKYRNEYVSIVFQSYNLIPYLTALENIIIAMDISNKISNKQKKERAIKLLKSVGITEEKFNRIVNKLSGGEQQRVAIARALSTDPELILADEPTGNLDNEIQIEITEIFKKLAHDNNKCIIIVTHSHELVNHADVNIKLSGGVFQ